MRRAAAAALAVVAAFAAPVSAAPCADGPEVLLSKVEALRVVFPRCERVLEQRRMLDDEERRALETALRRPLEEKGFLVYLGLAGEKGEQVDGFAVITNEIGKTEPITFIVGAERAPGDSKPEKPVKSVTPAKLRVRRVMRRSWKRSSASTAISGGLVAGNAASSAMMRPSKIVSPVQITLNAPPNSSLARSK